MDDSDFTEDDLLALSWNWRKSALLIEVHAAGLFDAMNGTWQSADEIADSLGFDHRATGLLLIALAGLGLVEKSGERYRNSSGAERLLKKSSPDYRGALLELDRRAMGNWACIGDVVKSGEPIAKPEQNKDEERAWKKTFSGAMHVLAQQKIARLLEILPAKDGDHILDIGCGPATYLIALTQRYARLTGVAFDMPVTEDVVADATSKAGVADRISFKGGDISNANFEGAYDGVLISQVLHIFAPEMAADLIKRAATVLKPGGFLAIQEMVVGPDDSLGEASLFAVQMMLGTKGGTVYTRAEISTMLEAAGVKVDRIETSGDRAAVVVAIAPA